MAVLTLFRSIGTELAMLGFRHQVQSLHTACSLLAANKALLIKLRKATGYTFINCKKALEKYDNDITKAESWLHEQAQKEGWSKASKLQGRRAQEGLIGVLLKGNVAVMVEVNSETDFVARNEKFQQFVQDVALATMALHQRKTQNGYLKSLLSAEDLAKLTMENGLSVADKLALAVGRLGENISVRRAVSIGVPADWHIGSYVHGAVAGQSTVQMGSYGALVVFHGGPEGQTEIMGRKLGQHVVGEAPATLGTMEDVPCGESEMRLLPQTFLSDPKYTVGQYLRLHDARVLDFIRYKCGENTTEEME